MIELRPYQEKLIEDIRGSIKAGHKRILVQAWVGAGKTVVASEILKLAALKYKRGLFVAPRRQLVYQASAALHRHGVNNGLVMAGERGFSMPMVQVASFDTLLARDIVPEASIVIVDEAHHGFTKQRIGFLSKYPIVIGITATPALANGKGMGSFYTHLVESLSMRQMVDDGHLVPMRYFGAEPPDLSGVTLNKDGDYVERQLAEAMDKPELVGDIFKNYIGIAGDRTTLIFAVNCAHARHIHEQFLRHGIAAEYLDGDTGTEDREAMRLRVESGETKVIVNIGVMAFGTDWPRISCVIVARPTRNIATWIQMVGRGSRLYHGKSDTYVVYHGDNFDELGMLDEPITWTLDDKTTVKERKEAVRKEKKEPKSITCKNCRTIFTSRRDCPNCGMAMIPKSEAIPFHEAELKEIKPKTQDKQRFYAELLGYCRRNSKPDKFALAIFRQRYGEWPHGKRTALPAEPSKETLGYIKSRQIAWAKKFNQQNYQPRGNL